VDSHVAEADTAPAPLRRVRLVGSVALIVLVLDQLTKSWAVARLSPEGSPGIDLFWTFKFRLAFNSGMAFSRGEGKGALIGVVVILVVAAMVWFARGLRSRGPLICVGMVIGGALGNLVDRLVRAGIPGEPRGFLGGRVVDFLYVGWWPTFNIADAAVVVGGLALAVQMLRSPDGQL
jgi:signal peptidase II